MPRPSCESCGFVHFRNPAVGVAVVVLDDAGRVLLGRRSAGGNVGEWCIPCGYVEWGEDIRDAARREFQEETGLEVQIGEVCAVHSNFHNAASLTVGVWFYGIIVGGEVQASDDLRQGRREARQRHLDDKASWHQDRMVPTGYYSAWQPMAAFLQTGWCWPTLAGKGAYRGRPVCCLTGRDDQLSHAAVVIQGGLAETVKTVSPYEHHIGDLAIAANFTATRERDPAAVDGKNGDRATNSVLRSFRWTNAGVRGWPDFAGYSC